MSVINIPISSDIPKTIPGLQVWLDANDSNYMTISQSKAISQWIDKSSNAFIFSTITGVSSPILLTDSYNQGVFFNSALSNCMRTTTTMTFTSNVTTIFIVGNQTSRMNNSMMLSFGSANDTSVRFGNFGVNINDFFI